MWGLSGGKLLDRPTPDPAGPGQESVWDFPRPAVAEASFVITATLRILCSLSTFKLKTFVRRSGELSDQNCLITSVELLQAK